eukprot:COSAG02_NODE_731_length_17977_cov_21.672838_5_plen_81_part_00
MLKVCSSRLGNERQRQNLKPLSSPTNYVTVALKTLVKIYEAEVQDPHYTKLPGHFEDYELAKSFRFHLEEDGSESMHDSV